MKTLFKSVFITFALLILLIVGAVFASALASAPKSTILDSALSSDCALIARKVKLGQPESDAYTYRITVENRNQLFAKPEYIGNFYRYDSNSCIVDFELKWVSDTTLAIYYVDSASTDFEKTQLRLGGRTVQLQLHPIPRAQWSSVSKIQLPTCSSKKLKTTDWETPLE